MREKDMHAFNAKIAMISILLVCCFMATTVQGSIVATAPTYSVGDYWNYGKASVSAADTKVSVDSSTATKGGYTCIMETDQVVNGANIVNTTYYYRSSDMALVEDDSSVITSGASVTTTTTMDPPVSEFKFPMKVGDTWTVTQTARMVQKTTAGSYTASMYVNVTNSYDFKVVSAETVSVGAGSFDTLKITESNGTTVLSTMWYAPRAGTNVKSESTFMGTTSTTELKTYKFKNAPSGGGSGSGGSSSNGMMMYGIIAVVVIIIVVLAVVMVMMKKKKGAPVPPGMAPVVQPGQPVAQPVHQHQNQPPQQVQLAVAPVLDQAQQYQPPQPVYDPSQYQQPPQAPQQYPPQPPQ